MTCPLCSKLQQLDKLPDGEVVWQFPHSVAMLGPWQYHTGYCVLVSRIHAAELYELPLEARRGFLDEMCLLAQAIAACFQPRKMNYEALGNQVAHLHWHLFPRRNDDPDTLQAVWLGFDRASRDEAEKRRLQTSDLSLPTISRRIAAKLRELS